jgi:hypothetical protein
MPTPQLGRDRGNSPRLDSNQTLFSRVAARSKMRRISPGVRKILRYQFPAPDVAERDMLRRYKKMLYQSQPVAGAHHALPTRQV